MLEEVAAAHTALLVAGKTATHETNKTKQNHAHKNEATISQFALVLVITHSCWCWCCCCCCCCVCHVRHGGGRFKSACRCARSWSRPITPTRNKSLSRSHCLTRRSSGLRITSSIKRHAARRARSSNRTWTTIAGACVQPAQPRQIKQTEKNERTESIYLLGLLVERTEIGLS